MKLATPPLIALAAVCCLLFSGCDELPLTISQTRQFYHPTSTAFHKPKPGDYPIALLKKTPNRKFTVIGYFTMQSKVQDYDFIEKAAQYNARLAGGDAVLVLQHKPASYTYVDYPDAVTTTYDLPDPQSKADARAGKPATYHEESDTDWGDPKNEVGWLSNFDSQIIVYK